MQLEQTDLLQFQPQVELPAETSIAPSDYLLLYAATVMDPEAQMRSNSPFWRLQLCLFNRLYWLRPLQEQTWPATRYIPDDCQGATEWARIDLL